MSESAATILHDGVAAVASRVRVSGDDLSIPAADLQPATGWELKREGVCRGEMCVPLAPGDRNRILGEFDATVWFNLTKFASLIEQPIASDTQERVWSFGPPGWDWRTRTATVVAPDFTAPEPNGQLHALHDLLGRKMFLLFWASW